MVLDRPDDKGQYGAYEYGDCRVNPGAVLEDVAHQATLTGLCCVWRQTASPSQSIRTL